MIDNSALSTHIALNLMVYNVTYFGKSVSFKNDNI